MKDKMVISWKIYRRSFFICVGLGIAIAPCLLYNLLKNYSTENLIGTIIGSIFLVLINLFLYLFIYVWKIIVLPDKIVCTKMLGKKITYNFRDIAMIKEKNYIGILNKDGKNILRVSFLLDNYEYLLNVYKIWKKTNHPLIVKNNKITYSFYAKNFAITFSILGFLFSILVIVGAITFEEGDIAILILLMVIAILTLLTGLFLLLLYKIWNIQIENRILKFRNLYFKTKEYELSNISIKINPRTINIMCGSKRITKIFIHFSENYLRLFDSIEKKI